MNTYIFGILKNNGSEDNCHLGTQFYLEAKIDGIDYYKEWSIFDEINKTDLYKEVCSIRSSYLIAKDKTEKDLVLKNQVDKENKLKEREQSASISETSLQILKETMLEHSSLVSQFKQGNEKALNSLVGKTLGNLKKQNIKEDPFNINIVLKDLINV
jgi:Asp-tRNA(Asn)/Glu-tRNA(Gln) amidotransferase B subunit